MNIYKLISNNIKLTKNYSINDIEKFYNEFLPYNEYKSIRNKTNNEKLDLYLKYQTDFAYILKFLKNKLDSLPDKDNYFKDKRIQSVHLKAICDSKNLNDNKIELYGFKFGWLDVDNYLLDKFYECGVNLIRKYKSFNIHNNFDTDLYSNYAKYYEWRKIVWMRLFLLIKNIDKEYIEKYTQKYIKIHFGV